MNSKLLMKSVFVLLALSVPAAAFSDPPAQSGQRVFRFDVDTGAAFVDYDTGLQVMFGFDVVEFCNDEEKYDVFSIMDIVVGEDFGRIVSRSYGYVRVAVWGFTEWDCDKFSSELPLAIGMTTLRNNDNDVFAWLPNGRSNKNSYSFKANGPVESPLTGEEMRLHFFAHFLWGGLNNPNFKAKELVSIRVE